MSIISLSVKDDLLRKVDELAEEEGYSSRSELFRAAVRELVESKRERLKGEVKCILLVSHKKGVEEKVTKVKHEFEELVETQVHTHLKEGSCTELFILSGDGEMVKEVMRAFRKAGAEKVVLMS